HRPYRRRRQHLRGRARGAPPLQTPTPTPAAPECICNTIEYPNLDRPNQANNTINGNGSGEIQFGTPENDAFTAVQTRIFSMRV
ncbi:MAG: hypothetical protein HC942_25585, partial [Microcoleus sp. SU_5_6]|nr:hypothetical protein [Microcoleus sp. SU_5_6]